MGSNQESSSSTSQPTGSLVRQPDDPTPHAAPYVYRPLQHEDSIRLLQLTPSKSASTPLSCRIIEARRGTVRYEALSYVWGAPIFSKWLYEEDSKTYIPITENLFDALRRLCRNPRYLHQDMDSGSDSDSEDSIESDSEDDVEKSTAGEDKDDKEEKTPISSHKKHRRSHPVQSRSWCVWADAVCIDQSNLAERNHQVKSMASIFSKATGVLVWLGNVECGSAFSTLNAIVSRHRAVHQAPSGNSVVKLKASTVTRNIVDPDSDDEDFRSAMAYQSFRDTLHTCDVVGLGRLFANVWFTRAWILQEFLLAKRIHILMGHSSIPYDEFASALQVLQQNQELLPRPLNLTGFVFEHDYLEKFETVFEMFQARALRRSMVSSGQHTSNPQGRRPAMTLFQWCRLLVDRKCIDERDRVYAALGLAFNTLAVEPDYSLSFADIRLDLTKRSLLAGDFSVLYDAETVKFDAQAINEPSFVPSLRAAAREGRPLPLAGYETPRYGAGLEWNPTVLPVGPASIQIGGVSAGEVVYIDNFADALSDLTTGTGKPAKPQLLTACNRIASFFKPSSRESYPGDMKFQLGLWRTINLGFVPVREDLPYYEKGFNFQFLDLPYRQNIARCFRNRVVFLTATGSFGMGPAWTREGDRIVVFSGAETPFILRRATGEANEEAWRLVGDCYLRNWMYRAYKMDPTPSSVGVADEGNGVTGDQTKRKQRTHPLEFFTLC
jgi:hypothetical protein